MICAIFGHSPGFARNITLHGDGLRYTDTCARCGVHVDRAEEFSHVVYWYVKGLREERDQANAEILNAEYKAKRAEDSNKKGARK